MGIFLFKPRKIIIKKTQNEKNSNIVSDKYLSKFKLQSKFYWIAQISYEVLKE